MIRYMSIEEQVDKDFERVRRRALLRRMRAWLRKDVCSDFLPSFEEARRVLGGSSRYRGGSGRSLWRRSWEACAGLGTSTRPFCPRGRAPRRGGSAWTGHSMGSRSYPP
jgi:hypothetical protein